MKVTLSKIVYFIESWFCMMTGMNELNYSFVTTEDTKTHLENPLSVREMTWRKYRFSRRLSESSIRHLNMVCTIDIVWRWWFCSDCMFHQMSYLFQKQFSSLNITMGGRHLGLLLGPPDALSHLSPELLVVLSPHFSSVHIRGGLVIWIWKSKSVMWVYNLLNSSPL